MRTVKSTALSVIIAALVGQGAVACGSDDGDNGGEGNNGPGGSNQPNLGNPEVAPAGMLSGNHNGGTRDLTPQEVDNIENAACTGWSAEGENLPAVLQLVVDVSQSMTEPAPGGGNRNKWQVTREALRTAIDNLPASTAAGVLYYPNRSVELESTPRDVQECVDVEEMIPIAELGAQGSNQRDALDQSLDDAQTNGYTPTHDAYKYALENGLLPFQSQAGKFMLLITDGSPTMALQCIGQSTGGGGMMGGVEDAPTQPIIDEIAKAKAAGVRTFIIGSPGSEESSSGMGGDKRPWLSEAAQVGGTAAAGCSNAGPAFCHLDMTQEADFAQALVEGLGQVVGQIVDACSFALPDPPMGMSINLNETQLVVQTSSGSKLVRPDNQGDCSEGWQYKDGRIVLCAASCAEIENDPTARVQLLFGCTSDEVVPVE
ncbi:MAG TPA: vWA domain-containing protein [Polyangiaceae bacterium]|nr:vWA domain-containing protein [Polyangiaceae bacterium]